MIYKGKAGSPGQPPSAWPCNDLISLSSNKPLLIMFAHPRCPCTKASLGELEHLVARAKNQCEAAVFFYEPNGGSEAWSSTALIHEARSIPGVRVILDPDGNVARRFGVETSGHTLVYGADGKLLFTGGITSSRGHLGDNAGFAAVLEIITNHSIQLARTIQLLSRSTNEHESKLGPLSTVFCLARATSAIAECFRCYECQCWRERNHFGSKK